MTFICLISRQISAIKLWLYLANGKKLDLRFMQDFRFGQIFIFRIFSVQILFSIANFITSRSFWTLSFRWIFFRWVMIVCILIFSLLAISLVFFPSFMSCITSNSRWVSLIFFDSTLIYTEMNAGRGFEPCQR